MNSNRIAILSLAVAVASFLYNPISEFLKGEDLRIKTGDNVLISSTFGNLGFNQFIQINNLGNDKGTIKKIKIYVKRIDNKGLKSIYSAQNFCYDKFLSDNSPVIIPFAETILKPNENWSGFVNFYNFSKKEDEYKLSAYKDLINDELDSINEVYRFNLISPSKNCASEKAFNPMKEYIEDKLKILETGEYFYLLMAWDDKKVEPLVTKLYSFSIYPSDLDILRRNTTELKKGMWMNYFPNNRNFGFLSTLTEINDSDRIKQLLEEFKRYE